VNTTSRPDPDDQPIVVGLMSISQDAPEATSLREALEDRGAVVHDWTLSANLVPESSLREADVLLVSARVLDSSVSALIRRISALSSPYLIVLSETDDVVDRIVALELGADDFISSASDPREILARAKSLMRRGAQRQTRMSRPMMGDASRSWILNDVSRLLRSPTGTVCELSRRDVELIEALVDETTSVLSVEKYSAEANSLRVSISRLRRKFRKVSQEPLPIRNIWGLGYAFDAPLERVNSSA
jgi:DNA-binding response OmpR family regulator